MSCNLVVCCDLLDDGLLTSGVIPAVSHALANLALPNALLIPASITVKCQVNNTYLFTQPQQVRPIA